MNVLDLKAERVRGSSVGSPIGWGASEVVKDWSGKFVKTDASGRAEIAGDGDTQLIGWVDSAAGTKSSTEGADTGVLYNSSEDVFRMPLAFAAATYTVNYSDAVLWETCDLIVIDGVQKANLTTSTEDVIVVVGGKAATSATANDGYVEVKLNPNKMHTAGVA